MATTSTEQEIDIGDLPFGVAIRAVTPDNIAKWIQLGWRDFRASGSVSFVYGLLVIAAGAGLTAGLYMAGMEEMILSFCAGFLLIGPLLTVGLYEVSREIEKGEKPTLAKALFAWRANTRNLIGIGIALALILVVWIRLTVVIYALVFPETDMTIRALVEHGLFTEAGRAVLLIGTLIGGAFALLVYFCCVTALPMMLHFPADISGAVEISVMAAFRNFSVMVLWAVLIVVLAALGFAFFYVGLAFVIPVIGHASWHAYRDLIGPAGEDAGA